MSADSAIVPKDSPVDRVRAAWMMCVDIGAGGGASGLQREAMKESMVIGNAKDNILSKVPSVDNASSCHTQHTTRNTPRPQPHSDSS